MTITELLAANPGVKLLMSYNEKHNRFHVGAESLSVGFHTSFTRQEFTDNPEVLEAAVKKVLEAVR